MCVVLVSEDGEKGRKALMPVLRESMCLIYAHRGTARVAARVLHAFTSKIISVDNGLESEMKWLH